MRSTLALRLTLVFAVLASGVCTTAARAQDRNGPPWQASRRYLFVQNAQSFKIDRDTLVMNGVAPTTSYVADRPERTFGVIRTIDFLKLWSEGGNSMAETPPDATLSAMDDFGAPKSMKIGISNPRIEGTSLVYDVAGVDADAMASGNACVLFIDPSQASAAGRKKQAEPAVEPVAAKPINDRDRRARATLTAFEQKDSSLREFSRDAAGYAIFPSVTKGALVVGGARGDGVVYDGNGKVIGYSTLTQGTVGLQIGGQEYSEIIFFENDAALSHFKSGNAEFSAQASAVAVDEGASADAKYADGVAVFTMAKGGLMLEASVGGQGFSFEPLK